MNLLEKVGAVGEELVAGGGAARCPGLTSFHSGGEQVCSQNLSIINSWNTARLASQTRQRTLSGSAVCCIMSLLNCGFKTFNPLFDKYELNL